MTMTTRQKKLLAAAVRKICREEIGEYKGIEDVRPYYEAVAPIVREAVIEAAPEIPKADAISRCAPCLIYLGGVYVKNRVNAAIAEEKKAKATKKAAKAAVPKHGHPCEGCPDCGKIKAKREAKAKAKAGTELDLMKEAAAKAKKAPAKKTAAPKRSKGVLKVCRKAKPTKKTVKKTAKAAALVLAAAALFGFAGRAAAQCPGGNCNRSGYTYSYGYQGWGGWFWPGFGYGQANYYQAPKPAEENPAGDSLPAADAAAAEPEPETAPALDEIPEWKPVEPAEEPETQEPEPAEEEGAPFICPLAKAAIEAVNRARTGCGLAPLTVDPDLCAACESHSAYMKSWGFGHAPDGGRECIAENYATPAATVSAWLNSAGHAAILYGPGTKLGVGVVGKFYTLRIK